MINRIFTLVILLFSSIVIYGQKSAQVYLYKSNAHAFCLTKVGHELFYIDRQSATLYKTDGVNPPVSVKQIPYTIDNLSDYIACQNRFYFSTVKYAGGNYSTDIWRSDGTTAGTTVLKSISGSQTEFVEVNDSLFFNGSDSLYKLSASGIVKGAFRVGTYSVTGMFPYGNLLLFKKEQSASWANLQAYDMVNGTVSTLIPAIAWDGTSGTPDHVIYNDTLYVCGTHANYLYKLTPDTLTGKVVDSNYHVRKILGRMNNSLILDCSTDNANFELYSFDLSTHAFQLIMDIYPGNSSSDIRAFKISNWNSVLYFAANDGIHGTELWVTDGTSSGTYMIREVKTGDDLFTTPSYCNLPNENASQFLINDTLHFNASVTGWYTTKYYIATKNSLDSVHITPNSICSDNPCYWAEMDGKLFFTNEYNCTPDANIYFFNYNSSPGIQARNLVFTNVGSYSMNISWTSGYKGSSIAFIKADSSGTAHPIDSTTYSADSVFGQGTQIGTSGWYCIYNGSGTSVDISGLLQGTNYRVMVCAYNGNSGSERYNIYAGTNNPRTITTSDSTCWTQRANAPYRNRSVGFSIGNKGYMGTGDNNGNCNDFWEFDPSTNVWTQKADFGGDARMYAVGFSIGTKGYIGTGTIGLYTFSTSFSDFWEYNPSTNVWTQKSDFGGGYRKGAVGFSIGNKGYIGTGYDQGVVKNDFWEFDPITDLWTQKANFGGNDRIFAVGFSIGTKGYIGTGCTQTNSYGTNDFWEYDPSVDVWTQKANFAGGIRKLATGFSIDQNGYIGTGSDSTDLKKKDFWKYEPILDTWERKQDLIGVARINAIGFSIGNKGYIGTGLMPAIGNTFFEYYCPETITSYNEISQNDDVNIYPNPANNKFTLTFPKTAKKILIFNSMGQLLQIKNIDKETSMNFEIEKNGIYFIQIISINDIVTHRKIVIE